MNKPDILTVLGVIGMVSVFVSAGVLFCVLYDALTHQKPKIVTFVYPDDRCYDPPAYDGNFTIRIQYQDQNGSWVDLPQCPQR